MQPGVLNAAVLVESDDASAVIWLYDPASRLVAQAAARLEHSGPPGIYRVVARTLDLEERRNVVLLPGETTVEKLFARILAFNPFDDGASGAEVDVQAVRAALASHQVSARCGRLVVLCGPGLSHAACAPRKDEASTGAAPAYAGESGGWSGACWDLKPGHWLISEPAESDAGEQLKVHSILLEKGWTTEVIFRKGESTEIRMGERAGVRPGMPGSEPPALTHLALGASQEDAPPRSAQHDPIDLMAQCYLCLRGCLRELDRAIEQRGQRAAEPVDAERAAAKQSKLKSVLEAAVSGLELLPHSVDLRIIAVACAWELDALGREQGIPDEKTLASRLGFLKAGQIWVWPAVVCVLAVILSFALGIQSSQAPAEQASAYLVISAALAMVACLVPWWIWRRIQRGRLRFELPPMFADGQRLLLRMASLYEGMTLRGGGLIGEAALRQLNDPVWMVWNGSVSGSEVRTAFFEAIDDLKSDLVASKGCQKPQGPDRRAAAVHLAVAMGVPLSLATLGLKRLSAKEIAKVPCLLGTDLAARLRQRIPPSGARRILGGPNIKAHPGQAPSLRVTIIEGLVMVLVCAGLAAVLFPVFAQARAAALPNVQLSNFKNIGMALLMYADDYGGAFPGSWSIKDSASARLSALFVESADKQAEQAPPGWPSGANPGQIAWKDQVFPYLKSEGIFTSSANPDAWTEPTGQAAWSNPRRVGGQNSVAANSYLLPRFSARTGAFTPVGDELLQSPSETVMIVDASYFSIYPPMKDGRLCSILNYDPSPQTAVHLWKYLGNSGFGDITTDSSDYSTYDFGSLEAGMKRYRTFNLAVARADGSAKALPIRRLLSRFAADSKDPLWNPTGDPCLEDSQRPGSGPDKPTPRPPRPNPDDPSGKKPEPSPDPARKEQPPGDNRGTGQKEQPTGDQRGTGGQKGLTDRLRQSEAERVRRQEEERRKALESRTTDGASGRPTNPATQRP